MNSTNSSIGDLFAFSKSSPPSYLQKVNWKTVSACAATTAFIVIIAAVVTIYIIDENNRETLSEINLSIIKKLDKTNNAKDEKS